jgi:hypothetical protein
MAKPIPQLGYCYYPNEGHYTENDLSQWLPRLDSLGAKWLTLIGSHRRAIPETFLKGLLEAGIEPLIHIPAKMGTVVAGDLIPILTSYARWGARHVIVFDRPNQRRSWSEATWSHTGLIERYLDQLLPILEAERALGMVPVLPPLEPGGDYWDTAFLEGTLTSLSRRGHKNLLDELNLSLYAWTNEHPIDWGLGGPEKWSECKPYNTPPGSQDQLGFRIVDWYSSISIKAIGRSIPMLTVAGGARMDQPEEHTQKNISIVRTLESADIPLSLKSFSFHLLATEPNHTDQKDAWFPNDDDPLAVVPAIQRLISSSAKGIRKTLEHYVLLPDRIEPTEVLNWASLSSLFINKKPAFGFSPLEARLAQQVTIAGSEELIPPSIESDLRKTGCIVRRISEDSKTARSETQKYLDYFLSNIVGEKHV